MRIALPLALGLVALGCSTPPVSGNDAGPDAPTPMDVPARTDAPAGTDAPVGTDAPTGADVPMGTDAGPMSDTCRGTAETAWVSDPRLCLVRFASGVTGARGIAIAPNGDVFVAGGGGVRVLWDADGDGTSSMTERGTFAMQSGLNHGVAFSPDGQHVYASSSGTIYRWAYTPGARMASGAAERVVINMPPGGNHPVRPLAFDAAGVLYVAVGSAGNLDTTASLLATRSMIRRFTVPAALPAGGIDYATGEVYASGMRNEVGIAWDSAGRMWGVENGRDMTADVSGDVHNDNPAEEINRVDDGGARYFGYPSCWTEFNLPGGAGPGAQHGDIQTSGAARHDTAWCRNTANVHPPAWSMQAHWAPLGITEYTGSALPAAWRGNLFVTSHGSWNRDSATGRLVARATVGADGAITALEPIVGQRDGSGNLRQGAWGVRPVDIRTGADGALYFTDDAGGRVFRIGYR